MLFGNTQRKPQGLFGGFAQGAQQQMPQADPMGMQQPLGQEAAASMQGALQQQRKPGVNWLGVLADTLAGAAGREGPYAASMRAKQERDDAAQNAQQQRMASMQDWRTKFDYENEYERNNPSPINNDTVNDYNFILQTKGKAEADQYLQGRYDPIVNVQLPGDAVYSGPRSGLQSALGRSGGSADSTPATEDGHSYTPGQGGRANPKNWKPMGGASGNVGGGFQPVGLQGERITSAYRTPERNKAVGGVPNSFHTRRGSDGKPMARDSTPPPGMSMASYTALLRRQNPHLDVINEGDHVHMEPK